MPRQRFIYRGESNVLDAEARASAPGQFAALADGMVHYEIAGSPRAQPVILISGFSVPYFIWDPTFEALVGAGFRVLRYDLYGRGYSDRPDTSYDKDLFDRQLLNLLDALGIDSRIDLVGLSMGGAISIVFADRHPESVRRLCLLDPAGLPWKQPVTASLVKMPFLGELIMGLFGGKVVLSNLEGYFQGAAGYEAFAQKFRQQMQYQGFKRALLASIRSGITTGAQDSYRRVGESDLPVMLIWGREDRVVPFELSREVRDLVPQAEFHAIDDAAHVPHFEQPEVVNPLLVDFLTR